MSMVEKKVNYTDVADFFFLLWILVQQIDGVVKASAFLIWRSNILSFRRFSTIFTVRLDYLYGIPE